MNQVNDPQPTTGRPTLANVIAIVTVLLFLVVLFLPNQTAAGAGDGDGHHVSLPEEGAERHVRLSGAAQRLAAVTLLMAGLWLSQALPVGVTAMIPLALYPLFGIQAAKVVSKSYIDQNVLLFLGGFVIALGIERWGLHRRIALSVVATVGSSPKRIVLGFMLATAFLSMWISNTAATLMMLPIGLALVESLARATESDAPGPTPELDRLALAMMLGTAYAASIGGFSTLVGTPTNVQFAGIWEKLYEFAPPFAAGPWLVAVLPIGVVMLAVTWALLAARLPALPGSEGLSRSFFRDQRRALGPMSVAEWRMAVLFAATAVLWITREPLQFGGVQLVPGWSESLSGLLAWFPPTRSWRVEPGLFHDSTVAIGIMVLMFAVPAGSQLETPSDTVSSETTPPARTDESPKLMDWETASRLPWDILLLFGGGLAIANAFKATQLSDWLGAAVAGQLEGQAAWVIVFVCCLLMTFLTEVTSNVATVSALIPVLAPAAVELGLDPRLICMPAVVSASCAFMLPIATPPNAIVFGSGRVRMKDMLRYGVVLNLVGAVVITLFTFLVLVPRFGIAFGELPEWVGR